MDVYTVPNSRNSQRQRYQYTVAEAIEEIGKTKRMLTVKSWPALVWITLNVFRNYFRDRPSAMVRDIRIGPLSNALPVGCSWSRINLAGCHMRTTAGHKEEGSIAERPFPWIDSHRTHLGISRGYDWSKKDSVAELILVCWNFHAGCSYSTLLGDFDLTIVCWNGVSIFICG